MGWQARFITSILLLLCGSVCTAQPAATADLLERLDATEAGLEILETQFGPSDPRLAETLEQLADRYIALLQFDAAHAVLDRATQISRLADGLFTPQQLPLLQKKIANYANRGDWSNANTHAEHLLWLYRGKTPLSDDLVGQLLGLAHLHLRGVVEDALQQQSYHFRQALESNRLALLVANAVWGEQDSRVVAVIYQLLKQHHLQSVAIERGGQTGYALREMAPGTRWVYDKDAMRRVHYFAGMGLLQQMRAVFSAQAVPDREAVAMVDLYLADWQVLFIRKEDALANYLYAYQGLLEAGVASELVNRFLAVPEVLPIAEFFGSIETALAARTNGRHTAAANATQGNSLTLQFAEWSHSFPNVQAPAGVAPMVGEEADFALFSFYLSGLNEVSRWISGSFRKGIGVAERIEILELQTGSPDPEAGFFNKLHSLRFRPSMQDGMPTATSGTIRYIVANY